MRIVIIDKTEPTGFGGMQTYSERIGEYLTTRGHDVYFLRYMNEPQRDPRIIPLPFYVRESRTYIFVPSLRTLPILKKELKRLRPDLVYAYIGLSPCDFFLPAVCRSLHIPLTGIWHADFNSSRDITQMIIKLAFLFYMPLCRSMQLVLVFSEKMKRFHIQHGVPEKNILVLPNGIDSTFYTPGPSQFKADNGIKTGVLFLGRLSAQKNPTVLLKSFLAIHPPQTTKLIMTGGGDMEEALKKRYCDPRIIFTGAVLDKEKKRDIMRSCSIFVQPSIMEGVSLALLEAMATGLSCITSDAGNNEQLLKNAGTIIPIGKLENDLPVILSDYLKRPTHVATLGKKARMTIEEGFTEKKIYGKLIEAFQATITRFHHVELY